MTDNNKVTTKEDIVKAVEDNHIWLNAMHCINPTPEYCEQIGRNIIELLNSKNRLLPMYLNDKDGEPHPASLELARLTPMLYLSVNKS